MDRTIEQDFPVTVVIPTLGGACLRETIDVLNRSSLRPAEILVCIPADVADRVSDLAIDNVTVLATECRGQVAQRAEGFKRARTPAVMQLDDDLLVDRDCVAYLADALRRHDGKVAVAPSLVHRATGESIYKRPARPGVLEAVYYRLMNGADGFREGHIQKSGGAIGVDPSSRQREWYDTEWLAGGCVMHRRENLVLEHFFPLPGKAFCEDIIHSHHLTSRGVRLIIEPRAICAVDDVADRSFGVREFWKILIGDYRARKYFMELSGRPKLRLYLFVIFRALKYAGGRLAGGRS